MRYDINKIDFSLLIIKLSRQRITSKMISDRLEVSKRTVSDWKLGKRPMTKRAHIEELITYAFEILMDDDLRFCGFTDEHVDKVQQAKILDELMSRDELMLKGELMSRDEVMGLYGKV